MPTAIRRFFSFPDPVNETSARLVAAGVMLQAGLFLAFRQWWLLIPLVYGFLARVLAGPKLSPLGLLVTKVITPRLSIEPKYVPGPPKRFAQGIGLAFTGGAALAWALGAPTVSVVLIAMLLGAASLEAVFGLCLGCVIYQRLWGCEDCDDISERLRASLAAKAADPAAAGVSDPLDSTPARTPTPAPSAAN